MVKKKRAGAKAKRVKSKKRIAPKTRKAKARKPQAKRAASKGARPQAPRPPEATLEKVGEVTHYFPKVRAAAIKVLKNSIKVGDNVYIKGHTTDFKEKVASLQLDRVPIQEGKKGQEIGLLVKSRVRIGDSVYKI